MGYMNEECKLEDPPADLLLSKILNILICSETSNQQDHIRQSK